MRILFGIVVLTSTSWPRIQKKVVKIQAAVDRVVAGECIIVEIWLDDHDPCTLKSGMIVRGHLRAGVTVAGRSGPGAAGFGAFLRTQKQSAASSSGGEPTPRMRRPRRADNVSHRASRCRPNQRADPQDWGRLAQGGDSATAGSAEERAPWTAQGTELVFIRRRGGAAPAVSARDVRP